MIPYFPIPFFKRHRKAICAFVALPRPDYCVVCGERYVKHDHHCDPRKEARVLASQRERAPVPLDFGKSFDERVRDAEMMLTLVEIDDPPEPEVWS